MTKDEAIKLLVNATYSDEWQGNEDLTAAHNMAIETLEQMPSDDEVTITMKRGTLKCSNQGYIVYNKDWFRKHFATEIKIITGYDGYSKQPNEDCVSRQAVVELVEGWWLGHTKEDDLATEIKALPSVTPTQRWIPVSERLPKKGEYNGDVAKYYLVQNEYGDMLVARYTHSGYWEQIYQLQPIGDEIVAWMPLPKPYKAEMESNACKDCYYNDGEVHAECVVCDKVESEG